MASDTAPPRPKRFSAWRIALIVLLALIALLIAAGVWLLGTESGARSAFSVLNSLTGGTVQAEGVRGRLSSSVQIDQVWLNTSDQRIGMKNLELDWQASELLQRRLHLQRLHIAHLSVALGPEQEKDEPAQLPNDISLPFELQVDNARIDSGTVTRGPDPLARLDELAFKLGFDGQQYRLGLDRLALRPGEDPQSAIANISGQANLSTSTPYPIDARFESNVQARFQEQTFTTSGQIGLGGSLAELAGTVDLAFRQAQINGQAMLRPFSEQPLGSASIKARGFDLSSINPELPATELDLNLSANENGAGELQLTNTAAGLYNQARIPLSELRIAFRQNEAGFIFDKITSTLGTARRPAGSVNGSGRYADGTLALTLNTPELDLQRLDQRLPATQLTGKVDLDHAGERQELTLDFTEPLKKEPLSLSAHAILTDDKVTVDQAVLKVAKGEANLSGHAALSGSQNFAAQGRVRRFRPQDLGNFPQLPRMVLNGNFDVSGTRAPQLTADLAFRIADSELAGNPLRGEGRARLRGEQVAVPNLLLIAGANRITAQGELSERNSKLTFSIQAPRLAQLGSGFGGAVVADGSATGTVAKPKIDVEWKANEVRLPGKVRIDQTEGSAQIDIDRDRPFSLVSAVVDASASGLNTDEQKLASLSAQLRFSPQPTAPLSIAIRAKGIAAGEFRADSFTVNVDGTTARHSLDARLTEPRQSWSLAASGGLDDLARAPSWEGSIDRLDAAGRITAELAAPAPLAVSSERVRLDRFRLDSNAAIIAVEQFVKNPKQITTRGRIERLQVGQVLKFVGPSPAVATDLQLDGSWDLNIAESINGTASLQRTGGDVVIQGGVPVELGLSTLQADIAATNGRINLELNAAGKQLGRIEVDAGTSIAGGANGFSVPSDAPLSAKARIDVPTIAWVGPMLAPTSITEGRIEGNFSAEGTVAEPRLAGRIGGSNLRFYSADLGVDFRNGELASEFQGSELLVQSLRFRNEDGQLTISGPISFDDGKPVVNLALAAERFQLLNQSDRRLNLSGQSRISLADGRAAVTGEFLVNSGFFDIGREGTPQLSDDVVIVGGKEDSENKITPALNILVNLGDGVKLEGRGLDAVLVGEVRVQNPPGEELQAYGTLRIAKGTYAAYGRELDIERGVVRLSGPVNNPALNILAMRRGLEVEAGVSIQGTALAPRIELVSEPSVPDAEKLSWLVLGRGLSGVGESELGSLQDAAGALLSQGAAAGVSSQIANAFGLDTVSLSRSDDSLEQRIITIGKQISSRLYVSYQRGLEEANNAVLLRYTLTPRFSVELEAGARSALSLFYNITFD
jgi:translocation and assembly module TamB